MLRMDGWSHEITVLVNNGAETERKDEFVEVSLTVPSEQITDPAREVRVIAKTAWNNWETLLPCQIGGVEKNGARISFRVAFFADIAARSTARYGVVFGNPTAPPPDQKLTIYTREKQDVIEVDNPGYIISIDKKSGQIRDTIYKYFRTGFLIPIDLTRGQGVQPGLTLDYAVTESPGKVKAVSISAADCPPENFFSENGAVCARIKTTRRLSSPSGIAASPPILATEMLLPASQPFVHIRETLEFPSDTPLFNLRVANHRFPENIYSHFTFRPVTPGFKHTEIEEMGHLLIDHSLAGDLPEGSVFSGFMPMLMPWTALLNIHRNKWFTQTRFLLDWHYDGPQYRPATYLLRENGGYETTIMPVYTKNTSDPANITVVPAGTRLSYSMAVYFSPFEEVVWGKKTNEVGRLMNSPLKISVHPRLIREDDTWGDHPVFTCAGSRLCDYQTSGVR